MIGFGLIVPSALSSSVTPFPQIAGTAAALAILPAMAPLRIDSVLVVVPPGQAPP